MFGKLITDDGTPGKVKLNNKGYAQLRIEGIDALETHYTAGKKRHQPLQYGNAATKKLLSILGFTGVRWGVQ